MQVMVYFLLCNCDLPFAILISACRAMKRQTCNISAISPRGEVSMCYITFKTPTIQLTLGNRGSAFGSSSSSVKPSHTWSHFSIFNCVHSTDQQSVYPLCPKTTENSRTTRYQWSMRKKKKQKTSDVVGCRPKFTDIFLITKHCCNKLDMQQLQ